MQKATRTLGDSLVHPGLLIVTQETVSTVVLKPKGHFYSLNKIFNLFVVVAAAAAV